MTMNDVYRKTFFYNFSWYGHSDLKSEGCQFGILGQFNMTAKIQDVKRVALKR